MDSNFLSNYNFFNLIISFTRKIKMIQHGIKVGILCLLFCCSSCSKEENKKQLFKQSQYVLVESAFFNPDEYDVAAIQKVISRSLIKIGKIEEGQKESPKTDSLLAIVINQIGEDSLAKGVLWNKLPVIQISMQLTSPTPIQNNADIFISGLIWKEDRFVDSTQQDLSSKIEKTVEYMLQSLQTNYEKAGIQPTFFIAKQ